MENVFFDGDIFGIVDNGVLAVLAILGIDIDKKLGGSGVMGGLFGALLGNSLSDLFAALLDPSTRDLAGGIFAGCMYVVVIVYAYIKVSKKTL
ncbi:MAG: hypothetical protein QF513_00330 [Gammaproteobacteria bacterium]|jgi:hypothetical protein|nr:hypothetical protein [Gammaproteobacteria bacterium]MBQ09233.1 hypothetical protein [Gammaproteobacteria bacterium]MDP6146227.1 hypothetical protein [Gammaproteobacteria bacterium]HJL80325.1 hypothetical protein [Gammaproteobacteria bacterium]HJM09646.1 hypothetical protein [Gammaproteobacteria bacterium]|tara:strand:+ start:43670 stop:43948 length:279 start_codon:yes stop_codon:yes gene_type:complete